MREFNRIIRVSAKIFFFAFIVSLNSGCANIPIKDGGLAIDKDTTAGIEDLGVAKLTRGF